MGVIFLLIFNCFGGGGGGGVWKGIREGGIMAYAVDWAYV